MSYDTIDLQIHDGVARLTLNRPAAANAMNLELARDLMAAALQCDEDPAVRAVVIAGNGPMFCGGGDLKAFAGKGAALPQYLKEVTRCLHAAVSHLTRMDAPVIAAVHGSAAGGGMSLACAADFVLAAEARASPWPTRAGLTPDVSSTYFLARTVGLRRAMELSLTSRVLSAAEAAVLGIVTTVVPMPAARGSARARRLRRRPHRGLRRDQAAAARGLDVDAGDADGARGAHHRRHHARPRCARRHRRVRRQAPAAIHRPVTGIGCTGLRAGGARKRPPCGVHLPRSRALRAGARAARRRDAHGLHHATAVASDRHRQTPVLPNSLVWESRTRRCRGRRGRRGRCSTRVPGRSADGQRSGSRSTTIRSA